MAALPTPPAVAAPPAPATPSAVAVIPPAVVTPVAPLTPVTPTGKKDVAAADHPAKPRQEPKKTAEARQKAKFAALTKRLTMAHAHPATHHVATAAPVPPPGAIVPPPSYYPPGPYQRLVYGGPPPGLYGGWGGYRGRSPFYP